MQDCDVKYFTVAFFGNKQRNMSAGILIIRYYGNVNVDYRRYEFWG